MNTVTQSLTDDRDLLRIVACGSVDDGKSTLIGRLLVETGSVPDDQLETLALLSRRFGTTGDDLDYALLLDGLESEREQGITIDVAYRYFGTSRRAFVVADTPGHIQYTRNMVTGASNADLAVLLVDARSGLTNQTMRHTRLVALLGIRHVLLVVNKMDLADFSAGVFSSVYASYQAFAADVGIERIVAVPVSARHGDNVVDSSVRMPWYEGLSVLRCLESIEVRAKDEGAAARFVVQSAIRGSEDFRSVAGFVAAGKIAAGDDVTIVRSGQQTKIGRIVTLDGDLAGADQGEAISLVLSDHTDVGRGDMIVPSHALPERADQFAAHLVWFEEAPLLPGRSHYLRLGTQIVSASVTALKHKVDIETGAHIAARTLNINEIGYCNFSTSDPIAFDSYAACRATGAFILIDRISARTVGAGFIDFALQRAANIRWQHSAIDKVARARMKAQKPAVVWLTGLPGAGKSTILCIVEKRLTALGFHTYLLDGDNLRKGLNRDLGFTDADRVENVRRAGHVAHLMLDAGLIVLCAFISPFRAERRAVRELMDPGEFIEVFVDTPLEVCMERDPKGLYAKARAGKVSHVTGVDSPYERSEQVEIVVDTTKHTAEELAERIVDEVVARNVAEPRQ
jgi:bifunctional enzyme CysN/CysC